MSEVIGPGKKHFMIDATFKVLEKINFYEKIFAREKMNVNAVTHIVFNYYSNLSLFCICVIYYLIIFRQLSGNFTSREEQVHAGEFCSLLWRTWDRCVAREFIRADLDMRLRLRPIFLGWDVFSSRNKCDSAKY